MLGLIVKTAPGWRIERHEVEPHGIGQVSEGSLHVLSNVGIELPHADAVLGRQENSCQFGESHGLALNAHGVDPGHLCCRLFLSEGCANIGQQAAQCMFGSVGVKADLAAVRVDEAGDVADREPADMAHDADLFAGQGFNLALEEFGGHRLNSLVRFVEKVTNAYVTVKPESRQKLHIFGRQNSTRLQQQSESLMKNQYKEGTKMREVSQFVVVFPTRMMAVPVERKRALMDALRREYPHYSFMGEDNRMLMDDEEFNIIPIMGRVGDGEGDDANQVYMCRPLDPGVIPQLTRSLQSYELGAARVH